MMLTSCEGQEKQDIILPDGYRGWFAIVFDCSCGLEKEMEAGRTQQVIPNNGILLVKYPRNRGALDVRFYYQTKGGKKLIATIDKEHDPTSDSLLLAAQFQKLSFDGKSKCSSNDEDFYEHEIVLYSFNESSIPDDPRLSVFKEKLEKYLRKE
jgi:hypothetical protein